MKKWRIALILVAMFVLFVAFTPTPQSDVHAAAFVPPAFGFVPIAQIDHVNEDGTIVIDLPMVQLYNNGSIVSGDFKTANIDPTGGVAGVRTAITTAVVNAYASSYSGATLARTAVILPVYQGGQ